MASDKPTKPEVLFHYHPWSRAVSIRWLLEELGVPYDLNIVRFDAPGGVDESYRAVHPHKKVPALEFRGQILTERAAIAIFLADTFQEAGLAPAFDDPMRFRYLRMLVYCDAVFDPAVSARAHKLEHAPSDYSFGSFDDVIAHLKSYLSRYEYAAGDRFTAADTQLASSLGFTIHTLGVVPCEPEFSDYLERVSSRPARLRSLELDADLARSLASEGSPRSRSGAASNP